MSAWTCDRGAATPAAKCGATLWAAGEKRSGAEDAETDWLMAPGQDQAVSPTVLITRDLNNKRGNASNDSFGADSKRRLGNQQTELTMRPGILNLYLGAALAGGAFSLAARGGELLAPFRVEANGKAIDMEIGNAAPFITDFDGDGRFDLMLGQRGECKLRIYRNVGSNKEPKFGVSAFFKAGGLDASLPGG
jgi:hypothetical protein